MQLKLCENIKNLRLEKGITQDALAEKMGVSIQAVSKWETGNSCPDISLLPVLAEFFGVSVDFLLTGKETEIAKPSATAGTSETKNADNFPFPDDGVYRVAQFCGSKLMKSGECDGDKSFMLDFSGLEKTGRIDLTIHGSLECGDIAGNVTADGYIECGDVGGNVSASDYVECGNVGENVSAGDYVTCGNVGGSVAAGDCINAQSVKGSGFDGNFVTDFVGDVFRNMFGKKNNFGNWQQGKTNAQNNEQKNERPKKKLSYNHPMTYVFDLGTAGDIRFSDNTNYGDSTISTRQVCVDFSSYIWQSENPPEVGDTVRVTGKLISPIDIDKMLVGIVDTSWEANNWLALNCDGQNRLKQNVYVEGLKAGEPFELDVSLTVKQKMKGSFKVQLAYGEQNGGCVTMESQKVNDVFVGEPI